MNTAKSDKNLSLLLLFALTLGAYVMIFFISTGLIFQSVDWPESVIEPLLFTFSAVPALFLQLLLCRAIQSKYIKALPITVIALAAAFFAVCMISVTGWDKLIYLLLLFLCIAPAVGTVAAVLFHLICKNMKTE